MRNVLQIRFTLRFALAAVTIACVLLAALRFEYRWRRAYAASYSVSIYMIDLPPQMQGSVIELATQDSFIISCYPEVSSSSNGEAMLRRCHWMIKDREHGYCHASVKAESCSRWEREVIGRWFLAWSRKTYQAIEAARQEQRLQTDAVGGLGGVSSSRNLEPFPIVGM